MLRLKIPIKIKPPGAYIDSTMWPQLIKIEKLNYKIIRYVK